MPTGSQTPISNALVRAAIYAAAGLALGTVAAFWARVLWNPILNVIRGFPAASEDIPSYGEAIAWGSGLGGTLLPLFWLLERAT